MERLKILVVAVACHPSRGSEAHFGWTAIRALARQHDIWAVVHEHDREAIESGQKEDSGMKYVHFCFYGESQKRSSHGLVARIQNWWDYRQWSNGVADFCSRLNEEIHFDLAHHVTMASWRMGSPLCTLGLPFLFGPVGGGEKFPLHLLPLLSWQSACFELLRNGLNMLGRWSPNTRRTLRKASYVLAANADTRDLLLTLGACGKNINLLSPAFLPPGFGKGSVLKSQNAVIVLFAGGEIEGRKGIALGLYALKNLKDEGFAFRYFVGGRGAELNYLSDLVARLNLTEEVQIGQSYVGEAYRQKLREADIYFLPSLRDSAPVTLLEAMAYGCIPVVANLGGPGYMVGTCGYRIEPTDKRKMIAGLTTILRELFLNKSKMPQMSDEVAGYAKKSFSEVCYLSAISEIYSQILLSRSNKISRAEESVDGSKKNG